MIVLLQTTLSLIKRTLHVNIVLQRMELIRLRHSCHPVACYSVVPLDQRNGNAVFKELPNSQMTK